MQAESCSQLSQSLRSGCHASH